MSDLDQLAAARQAANYQRNIPPPERRSPRRSGCVSPFLLLLCVAGAAVFVGRQLDFIRLPGDAGKVEPLLDALEKVKSDWRTDVSVDRLADDVAAAKAEESKLEHTPAFSRRSFGHLMKAVSDFETLVYEQRSIQRHEAYAKETYSADAAKLDFDSIGRSRENSSLAAKSAEIEMDRARQDLSGGN